MLVEEWQFLGWHVSDTCARVWLCFGCVVVCASIWGYVCGVWGHVHTCGVHKHAHRSPSDGFLRQAPGYPWWLSDCHPGIWVSGQLPAFLAQHLPYTHIISSVLASWQFGVFLILKKSWIRAPKQLPWTWRPRTRVVCVLWRSGLWGGGRCWGEQSMVPSHPLGWSLGWVFSRRLLTAYSSAHPVAWSVLSSRWVISTTQVLSCPPPIFWVLDTSRKQNTEQDLPYKSSGWPGQVQLLSLAHEG